MIHRFPAPKFPRRLVFGAVKKSAKICVICGLLAAPLVAADAPHSAAVQNAVLATPKSGVEIPTMLNSAKLSFPANTAVGTRVKVSDGFVVSGAGTDVNYFFYPYSSYMGKPTYRNADFSASCVWNPGGYWELVTSVDGSGYTSTEDVAFPWLVTAWSSSADAGISPLPTLTHPAVQQLQNPSSAQGGLFVLGGLSQDGVWKKGGTFNGKAYFVLLGSADDGSPTDNPSIWWASDVNNDVFGTGPHSAGFVDNLNGVYSLSTVATPDLASNWKNASDDSDASIVVTSITKGELGAGCIVGATTFELTAADSGRPVYSDVTGVDSDPIHWTSAWTKGVSTINFANVATPFEKPNHVKVLGLTSEYPVTFNGPYFIDPSTPISNGKPSYKKLPEGSEFPKLQWSGTQWVIFGDASVYAGGTSDHIYSNQDVATPDLVTAGGWHRFSDNGAEGAVTLSTDTATDITRDDVAAEANWQVVP